jgi:predicted nucleic acid-binding protein
MRDARFFVDTNLFVYFRDSTEAKKQVLAADWVHYLVENRNGRISTQVLNEFYVTVTQKLKPGMTGAEAWEDVTALMVWNPIPIDTEVLHRAREVQTRYQFSWWDSLVVASAINAQCDFLLTEDLSEGQTLDGVKVINPFSTSPREFAN